MINIKPPKYQVGQSVFAFDKDGLKESAIHEIVIWINRNEQRVRYKLDEYGDLYTEEQLEPTAQNAVHKLEHNINQLSLFLKP